MKRMFMLTIGFGCLQAVYAQDSTSNDLLNRSFQRYSPTLELQLSQDLNPALKFYLWDFSRTEMAVNVGEEKQDKALVQQLGKGHTRYGLDISSLLAPKANTRAWGKASYENTQHKGINMNLTSDYERVYPYITSDTLGPADQKGETYIFSGGYAQNKGNYLWGIEASIRNQQEYRQKDPRPRNRISDMQVELGVGYRFNEQYTIGLSTGFAAYKQAHTISMLSDERLRITTPLYNMTGLATAFSPVNSSSYSYTAKTWTLGLDIYPSGHRGWIGHLGYRFDNLNKSIGASGGDSGDLNGVRLASALNDILNRKEDLIEARAGWIDKKYDQSWLAQVKYTYRHRIGSEALIASSLQEIVGVTTNRTTMGMAPYYRENNTQIAVEGTYGKGEQKHWHIKPALVYIKNEADYFDPARYMNYERLRYGTQLGMSWLGRKHMAQILLEGTFDQSLSSEIDIENTFGQLSANNTIQYGLFNRHAPQAELSNYRFLSTNNTQLSVSMRWEWQLLNNKALFLQPSLQQGWYVDQVRTNFYQMRIGLIL